MTWVEVLPALTITGGFLWILIQCPKLQNRWDYRGLFDKRMVCYLHDDEENMMTRMNKRDERMGIQPTEVEWIHPLWRPSNYPQTD